MAACNRWMQEALADTHTHTYTHTHTHVPGKLSCTHAVDLK